MRLATIGVDLPATRLAFRDHAALDEHDVLLLDPDAVLDEYAAEVERHDPAPVLSVRASQALLADIRRRRADMTALLALGGAVVFHPPGDRKLRAHTLEGLIDVTAAMVLPLDGVTAEAAPGGLPALRGGEPFTSFQAALADDLVVRTALIDPPGEALFAGDGRRAAGFYLAHNRGHVLALPRMAGAARFAPALATLLARLAVGDSYAVPAWTRGHVLPGEDALRARVMRIEAERRRLDRELAEAQAALHPFEQRKLLLTGTGRALYDAASLAFWDLGCSVYQGPLGEADLAVEWEDRMALVQTLGHAGPVTEADLQALIAARAALPAAMRGARPVLLAVPYRDRPLAQRPEPAFAPEIAALAQAEGVALLTGSQLLAVSAAAWQGRLDSSAAMRSIFAASGPFAFPL